jgi:septal ring factor EnvC (AmiA/AmiB activator)
MKKNISQPNSVPAIETLSINLTRSIGTPISVLIHTIFFIGIFSLRKFGFSVEEILLILTTAVSLEAIYLAIFIQMSINRQEAKLHEVTEDIEDIQEDVEELGEDFEEITEDISEIQEDVKELGADFDEISDDLEEDDKKEEAYRSERNRNLQKMETTLQSIISEIERMKEKDTGRRSTDTKI